jgi:hypothetical protein
MKDTIQTLNEEELAAVAGAAETPVGRAILKAFAAERRRVNRRMQDPRLNTERVCEDFRYVLGEQHGVAFLDRLIEDARKQVGITTGDDA